MVQVYKEAKVDPSHITYIQAHATSTSVSHLLISIYRAYYSINTDHLLTMEMSQMEIRMTVDYYGEGWIKRCDHVNF